MLEGGNKIMRLKVIGGIFVHKFDFVAYFHDKFGSNRFKATFENSREVMALTL